MRGHHRYAEPPRGIPILNLQQPAIIRPAHEPADVRSDGISETDVRERARVRRVLALVACLLLAAMLRFPRLGAQSLWIDEISSLDAAKLPFRELLTLADGHPPLHDLLLKVTGWGTYSDLRGRAMAAVAGTVTVGLVMWFGASAFDLRTGTLAA